MSYKLKLFEITKHLRLQVVFRMTVSKARGPNIPKFSLQNSTWLILISGFLEAKRINKSYDGAEIENIYERLCLYFHTIGSLSFLADEPNSR